MRFGLRLNDHIGVQPMLPADLLDTCTPQIPWTRAITNQNRPLSSRVFILLSTYNGATYLPAQLDSLLAQTHADWVLYWRDDGSIDATIAIMDQFTASIGANRCVRITGPVGRIGPAASFMTVLRAVMPLLGNADAIAFADQDDVWLPHKLSRGIAVLAAADTETPALYCARLVVVGATLQRLGETILSLRSLGFPASLTQNIATGCTIMLNQRAVALVAGHPPPNASPHDWWCYVLVTAAGGQLLVDNAAVALYRQHEGNVIGISLSKTRRAVAAVRRGPGAFMNVLRQHVAALDARPDLLCETARLAVTRLQRALHGSFWQKLMALCLAGLHRQSRLETWLFRLWFLIG